MERRVTRARGSSSDTTHLRRPANRADHRCSFRAAPYPKTASHRHPRFPDRYLRTADAQLRALMHCITGIASQSLRPTAQRLRIGDDASIIWPENRTIQCIDENNIQLSLHRKSLSKTHESSTWNFRKLNFVKCT